MNTAALIAFVVVAGTFGSAAIILLVSSIFTRLFKRGAR